MDQPGPWKLRLTQRIKHFFSRQQYHHPSQHREPLLASSTRSQTQPHVHDTHHHLGAAPRPQQQGGSSRGAAGHAQGMMGFLGCCGPRRSNRPKRERKHRRSRRERRQQRLAAASRTPVSHSDSAGQHAPPSLAVTSVASDSEYHDAREAWSVGDPDHSPVSSAQISPRAGSWPDHAHGDESYQDFDDDGSSSSGSDSGSASSAESTGIAAKLVSCLSIIRASSTGEDDGGRVPHAHHPHVGPRSHKLPAGCSFPRRSHDINPGKAALCWDECQASNFQIRSVDYMQTKVKQPSSKAIYRLVAMDMFSSETKTTHVSRTFQLPHTGPPVVCKPAVPGGPEVVLPQLLIMNVQLPDYPAPFWGANDGRGQSIVYYFQLREDFDPDKFENTAALGLLQRFVSNGREADGSPTRDRLKLIVRVANLEEWARVGPLNNTEYKLLQNYNEKPVLTRPQHHFHLGANYLEVDLDVHNYAFIARKALWSYHDRLATVVWDMGFVIQGNCPEELPEQLLGCGRIFRSDFRQFRFLSDLQHSNLASGSLTPSFTASRNSMGMDRVASASTSPGAATTTVATPDSSPDAPSAAAGAGSRADQAAAGAAAAAVAAGAASVAGVAAAAAGDAVGGAGPAVVSQEAGHSADSADSAATSSRASLTSGDATPLVVSISPDSSAAGAAGSKAGKARSSSQGGGSGVADGPQQPVAAAVPVGSAGGAR